MVTSFLINCGGKKNAFVNYDQRKKRMYVLNLKASFYFINRSYNKLIQDGYYFFLNISFEKERDVRNGIMSISIRINVNLNGSKR